LKDPHRDEGEEGAVFSADPAFDVIFGRTIGAAKRKANLGIASVLMFRLAKQAAVSYWWRRSPLVSLL
jgi:hypothetical protein